jgi:hypothetical protein
VIAERLDRERPGLVHVVYAVRRRRLTRVL